MLLLFCILLLFYINAFELLNKISPFHDDRIGLDINFNMCIFFLFFPKKIKK
ncbi:uncharacterized protein BX663DRAFT_508676 [Cokeromyces recurvatus]|uniref:uncharacterized protein n=1 Tax=Cokeromyces recurvatus TaxID=90255 RepID=UPI00221E4A1C|nr:uncharacterized protein BX663DRAFT_508676 [Cokeromyces recurvatus]KAI7902858.1 hypothetical protein BX663DRAFT_508676 [Cokeromyces recurvatus]